MLIAGGRILFIVLTLLSIPFLLPPAHATGVLSFDWEEVDLPLVLSMNATNDITGDNRLATLQLGLYENRTGRAITSVSYVITIAEAEGDEILTNAFYTESGRLDLSLSHDEGGRTTITGASQEQFLNAWVADSANQPIAISSPEISRNETYDIRVDILGMYNIRNLLPPDQIPRADFVWDPASDTMERALIVPEFSTVAVFVITTAMIGIVIAASRSTSRRIFRNGS